MQPLSKPNCYLQPNYACKHTNRKSLEHLTAAFAPFSCLTSVRNGQSERECHKNQLKKQNAPSLSNMN